MDALQTNVWKVCLCACALLLPAALWAQSPVVSSADIGPTAQEAGTTDPFPSPRFGETIAIGGRVAMASIPGDLATAPNVFGRVAVFERTANGWERTATLIGTEESGGNFGRAIDIEGDRAVITASKAVYLYERRGRRWVAMAKATVDASKAAFSSSVKLTQELIVVHVYEPQDEVTTRSAVYVYTTAPARDGRGTQAPPKPNRVQTLQRVAVMRPPQGSMSTTFGEDVALNRDVLVIGAPDGDNTGGSAYVYTRVGRRWQVIDRLMAMNGSVGDGFGTSVDIRDGVIVVGAPHADLGLPDDGYGIPRGNVYVFLPSRHGWYEAQQLNAPADESSIRDLGYKVRLGRDLLAVRVRDGRGLLRGEDRVIAYDWSNGSFQFPREVARYEGFIRDIDMLGRELIYSRQNTEFFNYYITGSATILRFGEP